MSTAHALLGLLEDRPRHGYELKHLHDRLFSSGRELRFGQVYASLSRLLRDGLRDAGGDNQFLSVPARLALAEALARRPDTRAEGLRRLEFGFDGDGGVKAYTWLLRGRALEAAGDKPGAIRAYSRFLRLWNRPSPGAERLPNEARQALRALTGEGQSLTAPAPR